LDISIIDGGDIGSSRRSRNRCTHVANKKAAPKRRFSKIDFGRA
jgi:hypothetical protein